MPQIPIFLYAVFILTTLLTIYIFYKASHNSKPVLILLLAWIVVQSMIACTGFYTITDTLPPRFALVIVPPFIFMLRLFLTKKGRLFIDGLDIKLLTILHTIRIAVEIILFYLFTYKAIPQLMTFEGRNFDILAGITAPFIYYFGFIKKRISKAGILIWNLISLGLLINIVANGILSAPFAFQKFGFDQPNIAVLYFPFVLLPGCIVPLVLLSHLATIRKFLKKGNN